MLFIINKDIPDPAKERLNKFGEVLEFYTSGITYDVISNHPDIFFCKVDNILIYAPNTPEHFVNEIKSKNITSIAGELPVGKSYPSSAIYNAAVSNEYQIHKLKLTDNSIKMSAGDRIKINVNQGYCRCNLLPLKNNRFITSDRGINRRLGQYGLTALYTDPADIILPGVKNGFFGGACGTINNAVFITGSLKYYSYGNEVCHFLREGNYEIVELYDGPLFDSGSILVFE